MKKYVIQLSIEEIGCEGEVENYTECSTYYTNLDFYRTVESLVQSNFKEKKD